MSILNVEYLSNGFGDSAIFEDVSFRLLKERRENDRWLYRLFVSGQAWKADDAIPMGKEIPAYSTLTRRLRNKSIGSQV